MFDSKLASFVLPKFPPPAGKLELSPMFNAEVSCYDDEDQFQGLHPDDKIFSDRPSRSSSGDLLRRLIADRASHLRYLRSRLPTWEDAEDALQDATLKLIKHTDSYAKAESPAAWIQAALRNIVIDRYRRAATQKRLIESLLVEPTLSAEPDQHETLTPMACLTAQMPSIKHEYRRLLQQVYFRGIPINDVAQREQLTANNVRVRLHRARNALRQKMQHQCQTCPLQDCWAR